MAKHEEPMEQDYEAPTLESLGTVEEYTSQTDISIIADLP